MPDTIAQIDEAARRFHELYFGHLYEHNHIISSNNQPEFDKMPEHQEALRFALWQMVEEGTITINA